MHFFSNSGSGVCGVCRVGLSLGWVGLLMLAGSVSAERVESLDLERVVALALAKNPAFQAKLEERQEVLGAVEETAADAYPQIEWTASASRSRNPSLLVSPDFENIIDQIPGGFEPDEQALWSTAIEVEQPLYTGGRLGAARRLAELVVDLTEAEIATSELDLALDAAEAFYAWRAAGEALAVLDAQRQARQEALAVVEARYELAEATELERLRAQAALAEVEPEAARRHGEKVVAEHRLRQLLGLDPSTALAGPNNAPLDDPPPLPEDWRERFAERPEQTELDRQADVLDERRTVTMADGRPQLEFRGRYGRQVRLVEDLTDTLFADWQVEIGFSWSLFDGGRRKGQLAQLASLKAQNAWRQRDLDARIDLEIAEAVAGYNAAREAFLAAKLVAQAAGEAHRVAAENYALGVALQADLLDAQERESEAVLERVEARYQTWTESARLARALGRLPNQPWVATDGEDAP